MLTEQAIQIAKRLSQGEVFYASREPRLCPTVRDQLRSVGLEISSRGLDDVRFFVTDLHRFRQALSGLTKQ